MDPLTHNDYIRVYEEMIDRVNQKEKIIEDMTIYIANHCNKINKICNGNLSSDCTKDKCKKCIRDYFEERNN